MKVRIDTSALKHSHWSGHLIRFALGGAITVVAGLVSKAFGPVIGGLLLAFPAILPAALVLLERSQNEQVHQPNRTGARARRAVVLAAAGAATGSLGLIAFALAAWRTFGATPTPLALIAATLAWALVAAFAWLVRTHMARLP